MKSSIKEAWKKQMKFVVLYLVKLIRDIMETKKKKQVIETQDQ